MSSVFYETFQRLTSEGKLDPSNEADMYCLHHVFIPRINEVMKTFVESWNSHPVTTANNLTPNQLFIRGAMEQTQELSLPDGSVQQQFIPQNQVTVPRSTLIPCNHLRLALDRINPLHRCLDGGVRIYQEAIDTVGHHMATGCNSYQV